MSNQTNTLSTESKKIISVNTDSPLIWMDLEMSGLDPENSVILEIATIVTNNSLKIVAEGPNLVINHPDSLLESMDEWNRTHHGASGLIRRIKNSSLTLEQAETQTLEFIQKFCKKNTAPLCGNSICQDRRFLIKYMPRIEEWLHYRNIDVSTFKELFARWYPSSYSPPRKKGSHKAMTDIRESIDELIYYRDNFLKNIEFI